MANSMAIRGRILFSFSSPRVNFPQNRPPRVGILPLIISPIRVYIAAFLLPVRSIFVAPILPDPIVLGSLVFIRLETITPEGTLPIRYERQARVQKSGEYKSSSSNFYPLLLGRVLGSEKSILYLYI